jgi:transposase
MSQKPATPNPRTPAERVVRDIRRATRKHYSAEDKIRIVLEGLRGEESCPLSNALGQRGS